MRSRWVRLSPLVLRPVPRLALSSRPSPWCSSSGEPRANREGKRLWLIQGMALAGPPSQGGHSERASLGKSLRVHIGICC